MLAVITMCIFKEHLLCWSFLLLVLNLKFPEAAGKYFREVTWSLCVPIMCFSLAFGCQFIFIGINRPSEGLITLNEPEVRTDWSLLCKDEKGSKEAPGCAFC